MVAPAGTTNALVQMVVSNLNAKIYVDKLFFGPASCSGTYTLTVNKTGAGSGTVTSNPAGIDCGPTCSYEFNANTDVTLTAANADGSTFTGWSGGGCSGMGTCKVTMTASTTVTANFDSSPPPDLIFADGFESGDFSKWTACVTDAGDLSVTQSAALKGNYGMQAYLDDNVVVYCRDDHPNAELRYRARFYFNPHAISMALADTHYLLQGLTGAGTNVFTVQLNNNTGTTAGYRVRTQVFNDATSANNGTYFSISNATHYIEIDWKAASAAGANDGYIILWIDGVKKYTSPGIDNDTRRVEEVRLGAVAGIDNGTRGTYYFDAFESRRQTYIGP